MNLPLPRMSKKLEMERRAPRPAERDAQAFSDRPMTGSPDFLAARFDFGGD
jgi:hypothetical protein